LYLHEDIGVFPEDVDDHVLVGAHGAPVAAADDVQETDVPGRWKVRQLVMRCRIWGRKKKKKPRSEGSGCFRGAGAALQYPGILQYCTVQCICTHVLYSDAGDDPLVVCEDGHDGPRKIDIIPDQLHCTVLYCTI